MLPACEKGYDLPPRHAGGRVVIRDLRTCHAPLNRDPDTRPEEVARTRGPTTGTSRRNNQGTTPGHTPHFTLCKRPRKNPPSPHASPNQSYDGHRGSPLLQTTPVPRRRPCMARFPEGQVPRRGPHDLALLPRTGHQLHRRPPLSDNAREWPWIPRSVPPDLAFLPRTPKGPHGSPLP